MNKNCIFASNFEAFPESNPILGNRRHETFMAARLKPNLRMAESTLLKAGPTADAAQQNFQFFVFLTSCFVFFLNGARTARCFFPGLRTQSHFSIPSRRRKIKTKKTAYLLELRSSRILHHSLPNGMLFFLTTKKNESARYGGRTSVRTDTIANLRKCTYLW